MVIEDKYLLILVILFRPLVLQFLIGIFKGKQDFSMRSGKGFNPKAKYKLPLTYSMNMPEDTYFQRLYKKYHKWKRLEYVEKFPLSATLLVNYTDKWHRDGLYRNVIVVLSELIILLYVFGISWIIPIYFVALYLAYMGGFELTYTRQKEQV